MNRSSVAIQKLKVLDLFTGIGGFSLGLERTGGFETVAFCEIDPFCQKVLSKHWPNVPIYDDVRTLHHDGPVDVITGGYPCQPFSNAGQRKGDEDDRHLWPFMFGLIKKYRPTWVLGENVAGHISLGLDDVLSDLAGEDYKARTFGIPACAVDAKHRRDRVWIVAYTESERRTEEGQPGSGSQEWFASTSSTPGYDAGSLAHTERNRRQRRRFSEVCSRGAGRNKAKERRSEATETAGYGEALAHPYSIDAQGQFRGGANPKERQRQKQRSAGSQVTEHAGQWPVEPAVGRVAHGVSRRVDRLKGLGNAVVPQIPEIIGKAILTSMEQAS